MRSKILKEKRFLKDNSAVSPMIATIMLIGVVVVLGAVIAASSMKSAGEMNTKGVTATLTAEQQRPGTYTMLLSHAGGDALTVNQVELSLTQDAYNATNFENYSVWNNDKSIIYSGSVNKFIAGDTIIFTNTTYRVDPTNNTIRLTAGNTYHVVVRYASKNVLLDTNVGLS